MPWVGGKSRSSAHIVDRLPPHKVYVELFCGGCAVLWRKPRSPVEIINDADERLVTLLRVFRYHPDELLRELAFLTHSRVEFSAALEQPGVTDIQRAARFLLVVKSAFGSKVRGASFGYSKAGPAKYNRGDVEAVVTAARERLDRVTIECGDFADVVSRYDGPDTLFYADPPYLSETVYASPFTDADHVRLHDTLATIQGRATVSLNDTPRVRDLYAGWHIAPVAVPYSLNRDKTPAPPAREVLIHSA